MIKKRIYKQNKNFLAVICGETGSGKSWTALRLGEVLDPNFTVDQVVFRRPDFFELLLSGKLKKGSVIIFDEAGVGLGSRTWYEHKDINSILQTFRHKNYIVLFTVPSFDFVDKQARELFHAYLQMTFIDYNKKQSSCRVLLMQNNPQYGKVYYKSPRIKLNGSTMKQRIMKVRTPSEGIIKLYEEKKSRFTGSLLMDAKERQKKRNYYFEVFEEIVKGKKDKKIKNIKDIEQVWRDKTGTTLRQYYRVRKLYHRTKRKL